MQSSLQNPETAERKPKVSVAALTAGGAALVAVIGMFWFLFTPRTVHAPATAREAAALPMNFAEQQYLKNVEVGNLRLSRAENFLHQEVTILNGELYNAGTLPVSGVRLATTFSDDLNQIVLKETRAVLAAPEQPLASGERRSFEISFDHVPKSWNMQQPAVVVVYLRLPAR